MKKLGLIGGTGPQSTLIYYKELNDRVNKISGNTAFPELAIESLDLIKGLGLVADKKYDELVDYMIKRIRNLEAGGADIIALTAVTFHVVYDKLAPLVKVPFISIPMAAAEEAKKRGYKKVGLLGTIFTMENDYLSKAFTELGIEVVVPTKEEREIVNNRIANELEYGIVKDESRNDLNIVINRMKEDDGIEAVILGCTELPLALNDDNCVVPCLDVMDIHIDTLTELVVK